ncbi:MAG: radical SAM protein [Acidimicrobiales bacterium]
MSGVREAIESGELPGRVWLYSNYHCNLDCRYCLTESAPGVPKRALPPHEMLRIAQQAAALGFTDLGVTGGEPFLLRHLPETLAAMAEHLPTLVLTNGTLFTETRLAALDVLTGADVALQISLDAPDPDVNDEMRGPENFAKVVAAIPRLVERGIRVRIATTAEPGRLSDDDHARLCALHRSLGVPDEDHIVRPVVRRGRALDLGIGADFLPEEIPAELCITVDGAFWSPFGPTVHDGRLDTDLLVSRRTDPLEVPAGLLHRLVQGRPRGDDVTIGIR